MFRVPNQFRIRKGRHLSSTDAAGLNGAFLISTRPGGRHLVVIATDGQGTGWEHVSVGLPDRTPTWAEMCKVKDLFWEPEDVVVQLHPPRSQWISNAQFVLHLWRNAAHPVALPPSWMVGIKEMGTLK